MENEQNLGCSNYNGPKDEDTDIANVRDFTNVISVIKEDTFKYKVKLVTVLLLLLLLSIMLVSIWDLYERLDQPGGTSSQVFGIFSKTEKLIALKLNKAEVIEPTDDKGKPKGTLIYRYSIDVIYDLSKSEHDEDTSTLFVPRPEISPSVGNFFSRKTSEKNIDEFPNIEVFEWKEGKFKDGALEKEFWDYINKDIDDNRKEYEKLSIENLKKQAGLLLKGFDEIIVDVQFINGG